MVNKNWFHGIEHMTQDGQGYVNWKDRHVEHYSYRNDAEEKVAAEKLAEQCRLIESKGCTPCAQTIHQVWEGLEIKDPETLEPAGTSYFHCGCCGNMFKSTYVEQAKYDQDAGYGICDGCKHWHT